jgi:hypothetical protein
MMAIFEAELCGATLQPVAAGLFRAPRTPTPYPSPQGGGGRRRWLLVPAGRSGGASEVSLPLVGRGKGWGYAASGVGAMPAFADGARP